MASMWVPWTVKYRPKGLSEIAGNKESIETLLAWVKSWEKKAPAKKAVLLHGPPGTGKTVSVEALAREFQFDLVEVNASDQRTGESLRKIAGMAATQSGLFGERRLILLDEIDGINLSEDVGAIDAVAEVIEKAHCPVVLTANDAWDPKIRRLRDLCQLVQFKRLGVRDIVPYLKRICAAEALGVEDKALKLIIERNEGDMRSIINDLQAFSAGRKALTYDEVAWLAWRDRKETIFDALKVVFTSKSSSAARRAIDLADIDYEMLFEWIYENVPHQLTDPEDRFKAIEALAKADLHLQRAKKTQAWDLLVYVFDLMTAGVAMSKERTKPAWVPFKFPEKITFLSKTRKTRGLQKRIGAKVGRRCHVSSNAGVKHFLPYVKFIFENNPQAADSLAKWLDFDEETVDYLRGSVEKPLVAPKAVRRRR